MALLKSKIREIYNIYISEKNEKIIINTIEFGYFKRLSDVIKAKKEEIWKSPVESQEEKLKDLEYYEKHAKNLISKYIEGDGQKKKKKF